MSRFIELNAVNGVRNDVPTDRFARGDLDAGVNIDIDETGKVSRRLGTQQIEAGNMHSLWASDSVGTFVVNNGMLSSVDAALTLRPLQPVTGAKVVYAAINNAAYWTDGVQSGIATQAGSRQWGTTVPEQPTLNATAGDLRAGTYSVTLTYVRYDGVESGAPATNNITVGANSAVVVSDIKRSQDSTVTHIRLYMTDANGELPMQVAEIDNGISTMTIAALPVLGPEVRTQFLGPAPAGQVIGLYKGRAYIASGNVIYYSQPYEYELFDLAYGYIPFKQPVQTFAAVNDGVYIGTTEETYFLAGDSPESFVQRVVSPFGTVRGTEHYVRNDTLLDGDVQGMSPVWLGVKGLVLGGDSGVVTSLTSERYTIPNASVGASLMKIRSATPQFVTSIFN